MSRPKKSQAIDGFIEEFMGEGGSNPKESIEPKKVKKIPESCISPCINQLPCYNGLVDLQTGSFFPYKTKEKLSIKFTDQKSTNGFLTIVNSLFEDYESKEYFLYALGHMLTRQNKENKIFILYDKGYTIVNSLLRQLFSFLIELQDEMNSVFGLKNIQNTKTLGVIENCINTRFLFLDNDISSISLRHKSINQKQLKDLLEEKPIHVVSNKISYNIDTTWNYFIFSNTPISMGIEKKPLWDNIIPLECTNRNEIDYQESYKTYENFFKKEKENMINLLVEYAVKYNQENYSLDNIPSSILKARKRYFNLKSKF